MSEPDFQNMQVKGYPDEVSPMPCFKCDGKMQGVEYSAPVYSKGKKCAKNKTFFTYRCPKCGAETSPFAHWETVFKARKKLKKYYDDVRFSQSGGGQIRFAA